MKYIFTAGLCYFSALMTSPAQVKTVPHRNTIVLVHGAWMDAGVWYKVIPVLQASGYQVIAVNLPGHGNDTTALNNITLQTYVDAVKAAIGNRDNIILVGHSMGGIVITETAEQIPAQIKKLVYVGAFLPKNGESMYQLSANDKEAHLGKFLNQDDPAHNSPLKIAPAGVKETFAADAPPKDLAYLAADDKPEAVLPFVTPMTVTEDRFGKIFKTYVYTINDLAIGFTLQKSMTQNTRVDRTYALPTSHTPFFVMPDVLGAIISEEAGDGQVAQHSSPADLVDALYSAFGNHHCRAVHAKGIMLEGVFVPNPQAKQWTKAAHFQDVASRVIVRFSNFTGIPTIPDNIGDANPRGFAIKFKLPDGSNSDIVCHSFDGFPTSSSDEFRSFLLSIGASGSGVAKPTPLDTFLASHPVAKAFLAGQKNPASFATISYFGVNAFEFINIAGKHHFIRYQFVPETGEQLFSNEQFSKSPPDYLTEEIKARVRKGPIKFLLYAQVAVDGDDIRDPSIAWPISRQKVLLGVVSIVKLTGNTALEDKMLAFSPNNFPDGIRSADPMLEFRAKTYPISVANRQ
jgi:catalase